MKEFYESLSKESELCINCLNVKCPRFDVPWHFHPESEIMFVVKGNGSRFVGDHSEAFGDGDISLVGSNLPHVWRTDPIYNKKIPGLMVNALVVHFHETIFKGPLAILPEMQGINQLIFESHSGIKFTGDAKEHIKIQMKNILKSTGIEKLVNLIKILDFMAKTTEKQLLASPGYTKIRKSADFDRFDKAHRYMIDNFQNNIDLETISSIVGMTPSSFCRYFKKHTGRSFHTGLNEIRIGHACKLLIQNKMSISGVCFESGFSNVSNFNEQFKKIKGISPSHYLKIREKES